ncbi:retron St85 family effector protein [Aliivibrio fischeri]|uniref:retron St85 family effector protein n=1 Tax=Aliivibrio fischeri TaxID=668 RepID=UPI0007C5AE92|nr:retron St85 family effector protein [Aliivibrio fischeri]MBP3154489.1 hypothetical protein [Aliivibrio fischeri]MCE7572231.1 retron St85 family effector protein [Aliivibrio fischeri]
MWFKHPKYLAAKNDFIQDTSKSNLTFLSKQLPKVLFICGGDPLYCPNRGKIESYLERYHPEFLYFRAEHAWAAISSPTRESGKNENALELEEWLAAFSDAVIILVESFGTVAELGAFSLSEPLREKLLPILEKEYVNDVSFINTGPVKWVDSDSIYKPSIYTDFSTILTCMPQVVERLNRKPKRIFRDKIDTFGNRKLTLKEFLFFIVHIISSLGPINESELIDISLKTINYGKKKKEKIHISFVLSVCIALKIIHRAEIEHVDFYTCIDYKKLFINEEGLGKVTSQRMRARGLSNLIRINKYKEVLGTITNDIT